MRLLIAVLLSIILASACVQQSEIKEIKIAGHGDQVYTFANDIRKADKVYANDPEAIRNIFLQNDRIPLVFDGSNQEDNAYFTVVVTHLGKIQTFFAYERRIFSFDPYYFIGDKWFDRTETEILRPEFDSVLWLKGPGSGANQTSLTVENGVIYLQGTSYQNLTLAGDKLVLIVFNYKP